MCFADLKGLLVCSMLCLLMFGCSDEQAGSTETGQASATNPPALTTPFSDTLMVEGEPVPVEMMRLDTPRLPFSLAFPRGEFVVELDSTVDGRRATFYANFGGVENRDAFITLHVAPREMTIRDVRSQAEQLIEDRGWAAGSTTPTDPACPWAETFIPIESESSTGHACIGLHSGRPFFVLQHAPLEYGDGFGPRVQKMLSSFRWRDTGSGLSGG